MKNINKTVSELLYVGVCAFVFIGTVFADDFESQDEAARQWQIEVMSAQPPVGPFQSDLFVHEFLPKLNTSNNYINPDTHAVDIRQKAYPSAAYYGNQYEFQNRQYNWQGYQHYPPQTYRRY